MLTDARIANDEETRRREIERDQAVEGAGIAAREATEKLRIAQENEVNSDRIRSDREIRALEIERTKALEEAEIAAQRATEAARIARERQ